jgi:acetyl esterase/lipase
MCRMSFYMACTIALTFVVASGCYAQTLNIWPGVAPGSDTWTQKEKIEKSTPIGAVVFNVVTPTLSPYLPERTKATGTGIIIAPGGAFVALAMDLEGHQVARWLQNKGIAAFVLKYRILEKHQEGIPRDLNMDEAGKYGIADGIQAVKVVRQHAAEWGISPDRVGFMGFSAGAMVASGALLQQDPAARPNFAAPIYGGPLGIMPAIPERLPPIFLAWAQDDALALGAVIKFYDSLKGAGYKPEAHIFSAGGHGFGMRKQGTSSDHWIDEFYYWLEAQGFARRKARYGSQKGAASPDRSRHLTLCLESAVEHLADAWPLCTSGTYVYRVAWSSAGFGVSDNLGDSWPRPKQRSRTPVSGLIKLIPEYEHTFAIRDGMRRDGGLWTPPRFRLL